MMISELESFSCFSYINQVFVMNQNAQVTWLQDHPCKFSLHNGIILSSTVPQPVNGSIFIPVSRIISQCTAVNKTMRLNFGEDHVYIALPLKRHPITL